MRKKMSVMLFLLFLFSAVGSHSVFADTVSDREAQLKAELAQIEADNAKTQQELDKTKAQSASISRDVNVLTLEINQAKNNIKEKNIRIEQLGKDIGAKTKKIGELTGQIERGQQSMSQMLKKLNEIDAYTLPEIVFSRQNLSDALVDVDAFNSVNKSLENLFAEVRGAKTQTEVERTGLTEKQNAELDAKQAIVANQRKVESKELEKKQLLSLSKKAEVSYTQIISTREKRAQQIRTALFELRDSNGIQFGDAFNFAKQVSKATGVRPAFLLAILTQESSLGKNVGSCFLTDLSTGDGKGKNTGTLFEKVMKPPRDTDPFKNITSNLGRDWTTTPVSCPIGGSKYYVGRGFGGAMGPAQFIPSTWMLFESRIESALGVKQADPWKPADSFMASGMYLSDLGAGGGAYSSEIRAACKYYGSGGSSCTYGNQVMAKAANIQENMIDVLENN